MLWRRHSLCVHSDTNKNTAPRQSRVTPSEDDAVQARILLAAQTIREPLSRSDVIIVLCSYDTRVAAYAADLYREQLAPLLLFSGKEGANTQGRFSATEAEVFAEVARRCGVPSEAILLEKEARNTGENVRFSRDLLAGRGIPARRVIAVQKPFMGLRTRATFEKVWPEVEILVTSPPQALEDLAPPGMELSETVSILVGDFERVLEYPKLGFQTEQPVSNEARAAFEYLKRRGYTERLMRPSQS
jgi:uncharacterized SAM-binding protein YcdF (DUF218 family)